MIGEKIKEIRKQKKLSLRTISTIAGISPSTLSDIENGRRSGNIDTLEKIANALGVNQKAFFENSPYISQNRLEILPSPMELISTDVNAEAIPEYKSITADLIKNIIYSNIIEDPNNIPDYVIEAIIASLKMELKKRSTK